MSNTLEYVTDSSRYGGWHKQHIWAVSHDPEQSEYWGHAVPLCRNLQSMSVNYRWYMKGRTPLDMTTDNTPLEKFDHKCDRCQVKWHSLRMQEGHTPQGVFAIGDVVA